MKKKLCTLVLGLFVLINILYADQYAYSVDLLNINNDQVKITCIPPKQTNNRVDFIFPNIIPGSYALKEYGRYIDRLIAYDENGKKLKIKKADKYNFSILGADKLAKIEYYVNDSWEEKKGNRFIFQPGGTNIEAGKNFVLNNYGFFGYIEGEKNIPFDITISKPTYLKGYSYLNINSKNENTDLITASTYDKLADNPIMYCPAQDATIKVGSSEIDICVYSENNKVTAKQVAEILKPLTKALERFFGVLPVDKYLFMIYLADESKLPKLKGKGLGSGFGALEHNHCSFYFLPESSNLEDTKRMLSEVCAHEFLHILTPLNIHSKEIEDFNFRTPIMSKHLWMYEGMTEYFSQLIQMQDSITTIKDFMSEMRSKLFSSNEFDIFSMTEMSKNVVEKANQARYLSVYSRGALLAMMLDILIIDKSNGKNSLCQVMMQLAKKYGPSKPFNDNDLIPEIEALTYPEVGSFFKNYIIGTATPDINTYLNLINYSFSPIYKREVYYFGKFELDYSESKNHYFFSGVESNLLGILEGDVLLSINEIEVKQENISDLYKANFSENTEGKSVRIKIARNGTEITLNGNPKKAIKESKNYIYKSQETTTKATLNLKKFTGVSN